MAHVLPSESHTVSRIFSRVLTVRGTRLPIWLVGTPLPFLEAPRRPTDQRVCSARMCSTAIESTDTPKHIAHAPRVRSGRVPKSEETSCRSTFALILAVLPVLEVGEEASKVRPLAASRLHRGGRTRDDDALCAEIGLGRVSDDGVKKTEEATWERHPPIAVADGMRVQHAEGATLEVGVLGRQHFPDCFSSVSVLCGATLNVGMVGPQRSPACFCLVSVLPRVPPL
jgi:hypothetical protein